MFYLFEILNVPLKSFFGNFIIFIFIYIEFISQQLIFILSAVFWAFIFNNHFQTFLGWEFTTHTLSVSAFPCLSLPSIFRVWSFKLTTHHFLPGAFSSEHELSWKNVITRLQGNCEYFQFQILELVDSLAQTLDAK